MIETRPIKDMNVQKRKAMKFVMKLEGLEGRDLQAAFHPGAVAAHNPQPLPPVAPHVEAQPAAAAAVIRPC